MTASGEIVVIPSRSINEYGINSREIIVLPVSRNNLPMS